MSRSVQGSADIVEHCGDSKSNTSSQTILPTSVASSYATVGSKGQKESPSQMAYQHKDKVNYLKGKLSADSIAIGSKDQKGSTEQHYISNTPTFSTSDDSDSDEIIQRGAYADAKMRVGRDYQATPPVLIGQPGSRCNSPDRALCVWSPPPPATATEAQLSSFVDLARERYGYTAEQALAMLYWHKHSIELATADLPNFVPYPDEWTHEEKLVFEQAFSFQGKQFDKIAHALPDKTVPHLVKYYYQWKKTRAKSTALDRRHHRSGGGESGSESGSDSELPKLHPPGCGRVRAPRQPLHQHQLQHPLQEQQPHRRRKMPRSIFLDYEALLAMSQQSAGQNDAIVAALDNRLVTSRTQVQRNRGDLAQRWQALLSEVAAFHEPETEATQISCKWTDEELLLAVQGVRRYGKDFRAIAQLVGTKTEQHVRYFFAQYRAKFSLDAVLAEYYKETAAGSPRQQGAHAADDGSGPG